MKVLFWIVDFVILLLAFYNLDTCLDKKQDDTSGIGQQAFILFLFFFVFSLLLLIS